MTLALHILAAALAIVSVALLIDTWAQTQKPSAMTEGADLVRVPREPASRNAGRYTVDRHVTG